MSSKLDRVLSRVEIGDCWEWTGSATKFGYGRLNGALYNGTYVVHRYVWENLVGPIPDGLVLDHLCRNPKCCNPDHLEVVTTRVNTVERGEGDGRLHRMWRCERGHDLRDPANLYVSPNDGKHRCKECARQRDQRVSRRGAYKQTTCRRGHQDWAVMPSGRRYCKACRREDYRATRDAAGAIIRVEEWDASKGGWCAE